MGDLPWWMGLAPLMGFLLDALLGGTRAEELVHGWIRRNVPRMDFVMRQAFGGPTAKAGYGLAIWYGLIAFCGAWFLSVLGRIVYEDYGLFLVRSLLFLFLFSARRLTIVGIQTLAQLSAGDLDGTRRTLWAIGVNAQDEDVNSLSGTAVKALSGGMLGAAFIPLFWGLGGAELAATALAVHLVARQGVGQPADAQEMWDGAARVDRWLSWPAAWLAGIVVPIVIGLVGGRRTTALATFVTRKSLPPTDRLASALAKGFGFGEAAGGYEDGPECSPADVQRVIQVLFLAGMAGAVVASGLAVLGFHIL